MALQKAYYSEQFSYEFPQAYIKINTYRGNIDEINFSIDIFSTQEARLEGKQPVGYYEFNIPYTDGFTYSEIYTYMKTLTLFNSASDC